MREPAHLFRIPVLLIAAFGGDAGCGAVFAVTATEWSRHQRVLPDQGRTVLRVQIPTARAVARLVLSQRVVAEGRRDVNADVQSAAIPWIEVIAVAGDSGAGDRDRCFHYCLGADPISPGRPVARADRAAFDLKRFFSVSRLVEDPPTF